MVKHQEALQVLIFIARGGLYFIYFCEFSDLLNAFQECLEYLVHISFLFCADEGLILFYLSVLFFKHLGGFCEFSVILYLVNSFT